MKCLRLAPRQALADRAAASSLLAPVAWVALLAVVPTDCARQKIADRLSRSTGRKVTLGRLRVGLCGGVYARRPHDRRRRVGRRPLAPGRRGVDRRQPRADCSSARSTRPRSTSAGFSLRVLRRRDGSLELADLLRPDRDAAADPGADDAALRAAGPRGPRPRRDGARRRRADRHAPGVHRGRRAGDVQGRLASVTELRGRSTAGTFELAAQVDRVGPSPRFEGQLRLRGVALGRGDERPGVPRPGARRRPGRPRRHAHPRPLPPGQGDSPSALRQTLVGQGRLGLDPVVLDGSRLLAGLGDLVDLPPAGRVGDVWADLTVKDGRVATENLTVDVAKVPVVLAGWTDFDGRVELPAPGRGLLEKLPRKAQDLLNQLRPGLKLDELADVKDRGDGRRPEVTSTASRSADRRSTQPATTADRLREIGRRVRDRLLPLRPPRVVVPRPDRTCPRRAARPSPARRRRSRSADGRPPVRLI